MATTPYTDIQTIHNPAVGTAPPAAWGDQIRTNQEFFMAPPMARVKATSTTTSVSGTFTNMFFDVADWDTDTFWDSNSKLVVPTGLGGKYVVRGYAQSDSTGSQYKYLRIVVNGSEVDRMIYYQAGATDAAMLHLERTVDLAAADEVQIQAARTGGSATFPTGQWLELRWVSR